MASNGQNEWIGVKKKCARIQNGGVKQHETRIMNKEIVPQNEVAVQQRDDNPSNTTTKAVVVPLSTTKSSGKRKMEKRVESKEKKPQRQISKNKTKNAILIQRESVSANLQTINGSGHLMRAQQRS